MTPTMEEVAGWLREAADMAYEYSPTGIAAYNLFEGRAVQVEAMKSAQIEAATNLVGIGKACERCGWALDQFLWCTDSHNITVRKLLALEGLCKVEAITCDGCMWWDNSPWQVTPETRLCMFPEKRSSAESWGFINDCGPKFGCIHWEEKK